MNHIKKYEAFTFRQTEKPKIDKLYLQLDFAGGDADTDHPETHLFNGIKFSEYENHLEEIQRLIDKYKILKKVLDVNSGDYCEDYDEVRSKFGEEIANMFDNAPNDPQGDYQNKCYLSDMKLIGYDTQGNKHEAYIR